MSAQGIVVKFQWNEDIRKVNVAAPTLGSLTSAIRKAFPTISGLFSIRYENDDGTTMLINNDQQVTKLLQQKSKEIPKFLIASNNIVSTKTTNHNTSPSDDTDQMEDDINNNEKEVSNPNTEISSEDDYAQWIESEFQKALSEAEPITKWIKCLLPHEKELLESGQLLNITHPGATSIWLEASSSIPPPGKTNVYRPMGDVEVKYLVANHQLPETQPYQAIIEGSVGRWYSTKYLIGQKRTDTKPSTVVEFTVPCDLIEVLKKKQCKVEDGAISMGLGNKAGKGVGMFNEHLRNGQSTWRIVKVKRSKK